MSEPTTEPSALALPVSPAESAAPTPARRLTRFQRAFRVVSWLSLVVLAWIVPVRADEPSKKTTVFLIGDSTVKNGSGAGSGGLVVAAGTMALIALASPPEVGRARLVYWDFAGALTLIGLCAALLGEPEQAVALLERDRM